MSCNFGKKIRRHRQRQRFSIEDLAVKARIPWAAIVEIERGIRFPSLSQLERLLRALEISWHDVKAE